MAWLEMLGSGPEPGRATAAAAIRLVRFDARRPAAWVSLAAAGLATWLLAAAGETATGLLVPGAIAAGGLLGGAAIGEPRAGMPDGRRRPWSMAWLMRVAWPISGAFAAAAAVGDGGFAAMIVAVAAAATAAATFVAVAGGARCAPAVAVSLAVTGAAAAASFAAVLDGSTPRSLQVFTAVAVWGFAAAGAWVAGRDDAGWSLPADAVSRPKLAPGMPPALVVAALMTSLATMVVCYFLVPACDRLYAAVAGGWFLCLAVPSATGGVGGTAGRRLAGAGPGRPALPGSVRRGLVTAAPVVAVLGWPAAVALVLPAADGSRSGGPLLAILVLVGSGLLLVAALALGGRRDGELARATVFSAVAVTLGGLPGLPFLPGPAGAVGIRSVLSPGSDPARLPEHRIRLEPPDAPGESAVDVENSSRRAR